MLSGFFYVPKKAAGVTNNAVPDLSLSLFIKNHII